MKKTLNVQYKAPGCKRVIQRESREQQAVILYAKTNWPTVPIVCATRGKNLSGKTKFQRMLQGSRIKREGYEKGTPDLFISAAHRGFHGLYIEMKEANGSPSDVSADQRDFMRRAEIQGYVCVACFGHAQAVVVLDWYFGHREDCIYVQGKDWRLNA